MKMIKQHTTLVVGTKNASVRSYNLIIFTFCIIIYLITTSITIEIIIIIIIILSRITLPTQPQGWNIAITALVLVFNLVFSPRNLY